MENVSRLTPAEFLELPVQDQESALRVACYLRSVANGLLVAPSQDRDRLVEACALRIAQARSNDYDAIYTEFRQILDTLPKLPRPLNSVRLHVHPIDLRTSQRLEKYPDSILDMPVTTTVCPFTLDLRNRIRTPVEECRHATVLDLKIGGAFQILPENQNSSRTYWEVLEIEH